MTTDREHDALMAISRALTPAERALIEDIAASRWPRMRGADTPDILDILSQHDAHVAQLEAFYERTRGELLPGPAARFAAYAVLMLTGRIELPPVLELLGRAGMLVTVGTGDDAPATPEERLLLAIFNRDPGDDGQLRRLREHARTCTQTDHGRCFPYPVQRTPPRLAEIQDTTAVTVRRLIEAAGQVWRPGYGASAMQLTARIIARAAGLDDQVAAEIYDAIAHAAADLPRGDDRWRGPARPLGPGETLRRLIVSSLSGPDMPPTGLTAGKIAQETGATIHAVREELDAMRQSGAAPYTRDGRRVTWFLLAGGNTP